MPRYFFHVKDGETSLDHEGVVLASAEEARAQALEMMGEILRDGGRNHWTDESWRMHVMDDDGETVCRLTFDSDRRLTGKTEPFSPPLATPPLA